MSFRNAKYITGMASLVSMAALMTVACQPQGQVAEQANCNLGLNPDSFGTVTVDGQKVQLYTLRNANGCVAQFTNLGAKLVTLYVPDAKGQMGDVVQGYATAAEYAACDNELGKGEPFFGATIGRYGNRIANGKFSIDGVEYQLRTRMATASMADSAASIAKCLVPRWLATPSSPSAACRPMARWVSLATSMSRYLISLPRTIAWF